MYVTEGGDAAVSARRHGSLVEGVLYTACASWLVKVISLVMIEYLSKAAIRVGVSADDDDVKCQLIEQGKELGQRRGSEQGYDKVRVQRGEGEGNDLERGGEDNGEDDGDIEMRKPSLAWGGNETN